VLLQELQSFLQRRGQAQVTVGESLHPVLFATVLVAVRSCKTDISDAFVLDFTFVAREHISDWMLHVPNRFYTDHHPFDTPI
jgi:hypothetical protein